MRTEILGTVEQVSPSVLGEGGEETARLSKMGQLYTVDWKEKLIQAGKVWVVNVGGITAGAAPLLYSGGGAGTTIDTDQPELIIGVDAGYYLIPLEISVAAEANLDADVEHAEIIAFADRTQAPPTSATTVGAGGAVTFNNMLDGAGSFPGRGFFLVNTDLTDPVASEVLAYEHLIVSDAGVAASQQVIRLKMHYEPSAPPKLAGACSIVVCWGGSDALGVLAIARVVVACVPSTWYPVS